MGILALKPSTNHIDLISIAQKMRLKLIIIKECDLDAHISIFVLDIGHSVVNKLRKKKPNQSFGMTVTFYCYLFAHKTLMRQTMRIANGQT